MASAFRFKVQVISKSDLKLSWECTSAEHDTPALVLYVSRDWGGSLSQAAENVSVGRDKSMSAGTACPQLQREK